MGVNYFSFFTLIPLVGIAVNAILFYFIYKFHKNESSMDFKEKIRLLRKLVNIVLIIFIITVVCSAVVVTLISLFSSAVSGIAMLSAIPTIITYYFYYLIYKEYQVLIQNFEEERIFEDENVEAFKKIAKISVWILLFDLAVSFIIYIGSMMAIMMIQNGNFFDSFVLGGNMNINLDFKLDTSILISFIVCVLLNILSVVFAKAVEIYHENQLTI